MNKYILVGLILLGVSCGSKELNLDEHIALLEGELKEMKNSSPKYATTTDSLFRLYDSFCKANEGDKRTADYLLKLAEYYNAQKNYVAGAKTYERFVAQFSEHDEAPNALMKAAVIFESVLNDRVHSKKLYKKLSNDYPNTLPGKQAVKNLEYMDMDSKELIKLLENQNKEE